MKNLSNQKAKQLGVPKKKKFSVHWDISLKNGTVPGKKKDEWESYTLRI